MPAATSEPRIWTKTGLAHRQKGEPSQDVCCFQQRDGWEVITLADGVSTCRNSARGAEIACRLAADSLLENASACFRAQNGEDLDFILRNVQKMLMQRSRMEEQPPQSYASTLCAALVEPAGNRLLLLSRGDSLVLALENGNIRVLIRPAGSWNGTPSTADPDLSWNETVHVVMPDLLLAMTDGAWKTLYQKGKLKEEVRERLLARDMEGILSLLEAADIQDDATLWWMEGIRKGNE